MNNGGRALAQARTKQIKDQHKHQSQSRKTNTERSYICINYDGAIGGDSAASSDLSTSRLRPGNGLEAVDLAADEVGEEAEYLAEEADEVVSRRRCHSSTRSRNERPGRSRGTGWPVGRTILPKESRAQRPRRTYSKDVGQRPMKWPK